MHRIIIDSNPPYPPDGEAASEASQVYYSFTFTPAHEISDHEVDRRAAKIRRVLNRLEQEVTAASPVSED